MKYDGLYIRENIPLKERNTFSIGGVSRYYIAPTSAEELYKALYFARKEKIPLFVLGNGSNVLISDKGWPGITVHLKDNRKTDGIVWNKKSVTVWAGTPLNALVKEAVSKGYAGMEDLAGIPGSVGGAVVMNAGAYSCSVSDTLESVTAVDPETLSVKTYPASALALGYRTSILQKNGEIVVNAKFRFPRTEKKSLLEARRKEIIRLRKQKQPLDFPNCGSVFKRTEGNFAGALIEQCGLKGLKCGGAEVSAKHANFIINKGDALAEDVRKLIYTIQKKVYERSRILLQPEVIFIGEFKQKLFYPVERTS